MEKIFILLIIGLSIGILIWKIIRFFKSGCKHSCASCGYNKDCQRPEQTKK